MLELTRKLFKEKQLNSDTRANIKAEIKTAFANRLIDLLVERGEISARSPKGVSTQNLIKVTGCSKTMARRYIFGVNLPDQKNLNLMAKWLEVDPRWLLYGETLPHKGPLKGFDKELLFKILSKIHPSLSPEIFSFASEVYENLVSVEGDEKTKERILEMMVNSRTKH